MVAGVIYHFVSLHQHDNNIIDTGASDQVRSGRLGAADIYIP